MSDNVHFPLMTPDEFASSHLQWPGHNFNLTMELDEGRHHFDFANVSHTGDDLVSGGVQASVFDAPNQFPNPAASTSSHQHLFAPLSTNQLIRQPNQSNANLSAQVGSPDYSVFALST